MFATAPGRILRKVRRALAQSPKLDCEEAEKHRLAEPELTLAARQKLEKLLTNNIVPFWQEQTLDRADGGYRLNHDVHGRWRGPAYKDVITQSRTVWFFSRLAMSPYGAGEHLAAARHGYAFLRDRMWDPDYGGFYWEVDSPGKTATRPAKHVCAQAFALYALCEYARASHDLSALNLARHLFELIEEHAHDSLYGGYKEYFTREWTFTAKDLTGYTVASPDMKLMSTHLHYMEALTWLFHATRDRFIGKRLLELIQVQISSLTHKVYGTGTNHYTAGWTPIEGRENRRVSFGHLLKTIWMVMESCVVAGAAHEPLAGFYRQAFEQALRYGFDSKRGGFYDEGPFGKNADRREKVWYVQAEGLLCALYVYLLFRDEKQWRCFSTSLDWIMNYQADWQNGDWHWQIEPDGKPSGDKARSWKGPYHNGRAVMRCLELLPFAAAGSFEFNVEDVVLDSLPAQLRGARYRRLSTA
jgi:mannobiose 2-epimerase